MDRFDERGALLRPEHRLHERLVIDRLGIGQRRLVELARQDLAQPTVLADDLRAGTGQTVHRDQHGMRLLAQRVARQQAVGG